MTTLSKISKYTRANIYSFLTTREKIVVYWLLFPPTEVNIQELQSHVFLLDYFYFSPTRYLREISDTELTLSSVKDENDFEPECEECDDDFFPYDIDVI